jgi:hypothetical protein
MDSAEFLKELEEHLSVLPGEVIKSASAYYRQRFDEAGESGEMGLLLELGNPYTLAKNIIAENSDYTSTASYINLKKDLPEMNQTTRNSEWEKPAEPEREPELEIPLASERYYAEKAINAYKTNVEQDIMPKPKVVVTPEKGNRYAPPPISKNPKRQNIAATVFIGLFAALGLMFALLLGIAFIFNANTGTEYGAIATPVEYTEIAAPVDYYETAAYSQNFEGAVTSIVVENDLANVTIVRDGYFKVESDSANIGSEPIKASLIDGKFTVNTSVGAGNVTVHLPNSIDGEISVNVTGGTVTLNNIVSGKAHISATASSVNINYTTFLDDFYFNGTMTTLDSFETEFDKSAEFNLTGGSAFVRAKFFGNVKTDLTSSSADFSIEQTRDLWRISGTGDYNVELVDGSYYGSNDYPQPQNPPFTFTVEGYGSSTKIFFGLTEY